MKNIIRTHLGLRSSGRLVGLALIGVLVLAPGATRRKSVETTSQALTGSFVISGAVTSSKGPVVGATVKLGGSETRTAFSDATGHYSIPGLGAGSYQLSASASSTCASSTVNINNMNASTTVDLGLTGTGCASFVGVLGPTGPRGRPVRRERLARLERKGPAGVAGPAGPAGALGPAGPVGPAGALGAAGPVGPAGPVGAAGPAGQRGRQGRQGQRGRQGQAGRRVPSTAHADWRIYPGRRGQQVDRQMCQSFRSAAGGCSILPPCPKRRRSWNCECLRDPDHSQQRQFEPLVSLAAAQGTAIPTATIMLLPHNAGAPASSTPS